MKSNDELALRLANLVVFSSNPYYVAQTAKQQSDVVNFLAKRIRAELDAHDEAERVERIVRAAEQSASSGQNPPLSQVGSP